MDVVLSAFAVVWLSVTPLLTCGLLTLLLVDRVGFEPTVSRLKGECLDRTWLPISMLNDPFSAYTEPGSAKLIW